MANAHLSREEAGQIAEEAASAALAQFFRYFDVNIADADSLKDFRMDLDHLRRQRKDVEKARGIIRWSGLLMLLGLVPSGLVWVWQVLIPWVQKQ